MLQKKFACNTPLVEGKKHTEGTQGGVSGAVLTRPDNGHQWKPGSTGSNKLFEPVDPGFHWCPSSGGTRATRRRLREGSLTSKELKASVKPEQQARQRALVHTGIHRLKQTV